MAWTLSGLQKHESPREAGFFVRVGRSGLLDAESVTAGHATAVVEDDTVELAADGCASRATGNAANETAKDRASEPTERDTDGAADNAKRCACLGACSCSSDAAGRSGDGADSAAGLAAVMVEFDARGVAARTKDVHGVLLMGCARAAQGADWHRQRLRLSEARGGIRRVICI